MVSSIWCSPGLVVQSFTCNTKVHVKPFYLFCVFFPNSTLTLPRLLIQLLFMLLSILLLVPSEARTPLITTMNVASTINTFMNNITSITAPLFSPWATLAFLLFRAALFLPCTSRVAAKLKAGLKWLQELITIILLVIYAVPPLWVKIIVPNLALFSLPSISIDIVHVPAVQLAPFLWIIASFVSSLVLSWVVFSHRSAHIHPRSKQCYRLPNKHATLFKVNKPPAGLEPATTWLRAMRSTD